MTDEQRGDGSTPADAVIAPLIPLGAADPVGAQLAEPALLSEPASPASQAAAIIPLDSGGLSPYASEAGSASTANAEPVIEAEFELPEELRPRGLGGFLTGRIDVKIVGPYLSIMFVLAMVATFVVMRQVSSSLEQRFTNQLLDAGRAVNDSVVKVEQEQLDLLNLMSATTGVDVALAGKDTATLQKLLVPLEANSHYNMIDVIDAGGQEVLALRPNSGPLSQAIDPNFSTYQITKQSVSGQADEFGDKYADLVNTSYGYMLYSGGPVKDSAGKTVGAILVGLPFEDLLKRLTQEAVTNVTVYGPDGRAIGTTLGVPPTDPALTLDQSTLQKTLGATSQQVVQRPLRVAGVDYMEVVGQLVVRQGHAVGALGVEVPTTAIAQSGAQTRLQMTIMFSGVVAVVLVVGLVLAHRITRPLVQLVRACHKVAGGDLEQSVNVGSTDETGVLAHTFNQMVSGLRERDFIRDTFGKYMSEAVSNAILSGDVKLGGERKPVTVLISHIRAVGGRPFSALYESMDAEDVVAFLNSYFHSMVDCIVRYEGIVDKFVGEEILAVFGAPIPHEDDARRAVLAALDMRRRIVDFNRQLEEAGHLPIRIGVGLYSGYVVSGNIGSEVRMEYTVIGDTVNCTARTEELTKEYHTDLLIGDTTYELVKDDVEVADPLMTTLRGRTQQSAIYPVLGLREGFQELIADQGPVLVTEAPLTQDMIDAQLAAS